MYLLPPWSSEEKGEEKEMLQQSRVNLKRKQALKSFNYPEKRPINDNPEDYNSIPLFTSFMRINKEADARLHRGVLKV